MSNRENTSRVKVIDWIEVCESCRLAIANGEAHENPRRGARFDAYCAALPVGSHLVNGDFDDARHDGDARGFATTPCEACGDLAGDRFAVSILGGAK